MFLVSGSKYSVQGNRKRRSEKPFLCEWLRLRRLEGRDGRAYVYHPCGYGGGRLYRGCLRRCYGDFGRCGHWSTAGHCVRVHSTHDRLHRRVPDPLVRTAFQVIACLSAAPNAGPGRHASRYEKFLVPGSWFLVYGSWLKLLFIGSGAPGGA